MRLGLRGAVRVGDGVLVDKTEPSFVLLFGLPSVYCGRMTIKHKYPFQVFVKK